MSVVEEKSPRTSQRLADIGLKETGMLRGESTHLACLAMFLATASSRSTSSPYLMTAGRRVNQRREESQSRWHVHM